MSKYFQQDLAYLNLVYCDAQTIHLKSLLVSSLITLHPQKG
jgi:hypothetical protein